MADIVEAEIEERPAPAEEYVHLGRREEAERLWSEVAVLVEVAGPESPPT